jgi:hypothetical protein
MPNPVHGIIRLNDSEGARLDPGRVVSRICSKDCTVPVNKRPCCKRPEKNGRNGNISPFGGSLVHKSLKIGKVMAAKGRLTLKASGTCMYPNIRHGDALLIEPANVEEINIGNIAICRKPAYLFAHRVVAKGDDDGRLYIITRADRNKTFADDKTYDESLLGRVNKIERKGKQVSIEPRRYSLPILMFYEWFLLFITSFWRLKAGLPAFVKPVQVSSVYGFMGKIWWGINERRVVYSIRIPLHPGQNNTFFKRLDISEFNRAYLDSTGENPAEVFILDLKFKGSKKSAASLALLRSPEECVMKGWWLHDRFIRIRYRGTGLENALFQRTEKILSEYAHNIIDERLA